MALKIIYSIFLGVLIATFVGVGIAAFYQPPEAPDYPRQLEVAKFDPVTGQPAETAEEKAERIQLQDEFDQKQKDFDKAMGIYSRNVSTVAIGAAILILILSLILSHRILLMSDGLLFGGVLTLLYGIGWGFAAKDNLYRFIVVTIGLIVALALGYVRFVKPATENK